MRVVIWGAGAIGCFLAARLSEAGHDITLVGRPAQVEAINQEGLRVIEADGRTQLYRLPAATSIDAEPDLVLLTVKTQDVPAACHQLSERTKNAPVVAMQNGVDADEMAAEALGRQRVLGASVMCATDYLRPGEIAILFEGWIILGEPFAEIGPRTEMIRSVLSVVTPTYIAPSMRNARWTKLISNLNNALAAVTGLTMPELARTTQGRRLSVRLMKEGYRVARASGARLDRHYYGRRQAANRRRPQDGNASVVALLQSIVTSVVVVAPEALGSSILALAGAGRFSKLPIHGSTWQSLQRGKPTEIDYLNGAIVRLGSQHRTPTPWNARVVEAVREVERTHRPISLADLCAAQGAREQAATRGGMI